MMGAPSSTTMTTDEMAPSSSTTSLVNGGDANGTSMATQTLPTSHTDMTNSLPHAYQEQQQPDSTMLSQQEMASFATAAAGVADHLNNEGKVVLPQGQADPSSLQQQQQHQQQQQQHQPTLHASHPQETISQLPHPNGMSVTGP